MKNVRDRLDCEIGSEKVNELVLSQKADFPDYLNFFEYVAILEHSKQLSRNEIKDVFGYYLECLKKHNIVRKYIRENGYERLNNLLEALK